MTRIAGKRIKTKQKTKLTVLPAKDKNSNYNETTSFLFADDKTNRLDEAMNDTINHKNKSRHTPIIIIVTIIVLGYTLEKCQERAKLRDDITASIIAFTGMMDKQIENDAPDSGEYTGTDWLDPYKMTNLHLHFDKLSVVTEIKNETSLICYLINIATPDKTTINFNQLRNAAILLREEKHEPHIYMISNCIPTNREQP